MEPEEELETRLSEITLPIPPINPDYQEDLEDNRWELVAKVDTEEALRDYVEDKEILEYLIEGCDVEVERRLSASAKNRRSAYEKIFGPFMRGDKDLYPETEVKPPRAYLEEVLSASAKNREIIYGKIFELYRKECEGYYLGKKEVRLRQVSDESGKRISSVEVYTRDIECKNN